MNTWEKPLSSKIIEIRPPLYFGERDILGSMRKLTDTEAGYAAGVFDARLHFRTDARRGVELSVTAGGPTTAWLAARLGGKQYKTKHGYEWRIYNKREIANVLHYVLPHMIAKQVAARKVRDFCTLPRRTAKG